MSSQPSEDTASTSAGSEPAAESTTTKPAAYWLKLIIRQVLDFGILPGVMIFLAGWLLAKNAAGYPRNQVPATWLAHIHPHGRFRYVLVPHFHDPLGPMPLNGWQQIGLWLFVVGMCLLLTAVITFTVFGETLKPGGEGRFIIRGIFRIMRHPMFLGVYMAQIGIALLYGSILMGVWFAFFSHVIVAAIVHFEDKRLYNTFGEEYAHYSTHVPGYLPIIFLLKKPWPKKLLPPKQGENTGKKRSTPQPAS
jgi:protein-S-isoprenylcysteine O-methyltransferase Ste14